jgi:PIN domain nuclease of toxin-antitoxin system
MTTLLLDTHAFVWAVGAPERLGTVGRDLIQDPANSVLVSAATAWELGTKVRLGKFPEAEPLIAQYATVVTGLGAEELPVRAIHALRAGALPWAHRDPFDRMLAAQAMLEGVVLVTRDRAFSGLVGLAVIW